MSKLQDYLNQKNIEAKKAIEKDYTDSLLIQAQELDFKKNKKEILIDNFLGGLKEISKNLESFEFIKLEEKESDNSYYAQYEILIHSDYGVAQYYLEVETNLFKSDKEVCIDFESSGYSRKLATKTIGFRELENLDKEQFIIDCIEEFEQFD